MRPHRSAPIADVAGAPGNPEDLASFPRADAGRQAASGRPSDSGASGKGLVFRRKIDCGNNTETSAERLILRDPDHLLRGNRRPHR